MKTDKVAPRGSTPNSSQNRDSAMSNRDASLADLPPRPHTAWDDWRRLETPQGEADSRTISGSIAQGDSRRRTLSLDKDLPRLPDQSAFSSQQVLDYPQPVRQSQSHPRDNASSNRRPFWSFRTKSRRVDQREANSPSQTRNIPLGARRSITPLPGVGNPAVPLQPLHTRALVRPGTPMPASESSMPLLLASALLSQQASQILIELSSISGSPSARENDSSGRDDKLDVFKSRMRELAAEGNDVGRGLMDCVLGSADLPHGQTAGNALKRARSDLGGTKRGPMPDKRSRRISLPLDVHYDRPPHDAYQVHRTSTSHGDYPEVERRGEIRQMQVMLDQAQETIRGLQATLDVLRPNVVQGGFGRSSETERVRRRRTFWGGWPRK